MAASAALLLLAACLARGTSDAGAAAVRSVHTDLTAPACRTEIDKSDPNETPYLLCPGVGGYALIVRRVDAGRRSIDLVDPAGRVHPLDFQEYVTRHMSSLSERAEWRVATRSGRQVPVALIVGVQVREDAADPAEITRTYTAVAKITPDAACVTHRMPQRVHAADLHKNADSARDVPCAPPQPPML